jgi:hypothetical protein
MSFLDKIGKKSVSPHEAALTGAVAALMLDRDFGELERKLISLFRDQFPPLSDVTEDVFTQTLERVINSVKSQGIQADVPGLVQNFIVPNITSPQDRLAAYRYIYALAMADLIVDNGEGTLLLTMQQMLGLDKNACEQSHVQVLEEFRNLHNALSAAVLGLIVVTADGQVNDGELEEIKKGRTILDPIGNLDDVQFDLVFQLSLSIHDRYLLDVNNRQDFINNIIPSRLDNPTVRFQAFNYAAAIATSDGDIAQAEIDIMKTLITALQIPEDRGEAAFNQYMTRVRTIDGKPIQ